MNKIVMFDQAIEDLKVKGGMVIVEAENELMHYGILRRSGRYPWGSGGAEAETTRHQDFSYVGSRFETASWMD